MQTLKKLSPILILIGSLVGYIYLNHPVIVMIDDGGYEETNRAMLKKLSELVSKDYLFSKQYFQVNCSSKNSGIRMVNYNPEHQILSITEDDIWSGVSAQFELSKTGLNEIAEKKYGFAELRRKKPIIREMVNLPYSKPPFW